MAARSVLKHKNGELTSLTIFDTNYGEWNC